MTGEIIGRDNELSEIHAFLDHPGEGLRALVLEGDAGIGKSTLWQAAVAAARERSFTVFVSRPAETEQMLANVVLGDLFSGVSTDVLAALPPPRRRAFEAALLMRDASDVRVDARALGVAIVTLLPALADAGPVVLAIDDDQWMDTTSAATLGFAVRRLSHQPVLLLLSRRVDRAPPTRLEEAVDPAEVTRLPVGPLSVGAIQLVLRQRLGIAFPRPMQLQLHELSGGNPFYALELARAESLDPRRDVTFGLVVPPDLERLVETRLGELDARTRQALLLVAAHGRVPIGLLRDLDLRPDTLDPARDAKVIEISEGVVRFTHPLLASALYQGSTGAERRSAHLRLARVVDDPVHRGRHLALASEEPDDGLAGALEVASSAATDRGMPIAAAELAEHALRLTPSDAVDDRHRRAITTARAHLAAGEGNRARSIAAAVSAAAPAGARRAEALVLGADLEDLDHPGAAVELLNAALAEASGDPDLQAAIHSRLAEAGRFTEGPTWAADHAGAALRIAEGLDDDALRANALSILARLRCERGDPRALELAEQAYRLASHLADPRQVRGAGWGVGDVLTLSGRYEQAREWLERELADWRDRDEQVRWELHWYLAMVEFFSGNWQLASEYAAQAREISIQYGFALPQDSYMPALVALHRGQFSVAMMHARTGLAVAGGQRLPYLLAIPAICDLWIGSHAAAVTGFDRAEQMAEARGWHEPLLRWWRGEYVEALLQVGRVDAASRLATEWTAAAERLGRDRVLAPAMRGRGLIAAARRDLPAALDLLERAADLHGLVSDPFGRARALLALGVVRRRARQKSTARASLEAALVGFEALGAMSWAATARAELARIGGRQRIEGLSPSELSVATLVAEGRTNREIASALFLGERTVGSHLTHIYAKLGIRSRTELARYLHPDAESVAANASKVPSF